MAIPVQVSQCRWLNVIAAVLLLAGGLAAQELPPELLQPVPDTESLSPALRFFPPEGALMTLVVGDTAAMEASWSGTALGELAADEEMKAFLEEVERVFKERTAELEELDERLAELEVDTESDLADELIDSFMDLIDEDLFGIAAAHVSVYVPGETLSKGTEGAALIAAISFRGVESEGLGKLLTEACRKGLEDDFVGDEELDAPEGVEVVGFRRSSNEDTEGPDHFWYFLEGSTVYLGLNAEDMLPILRTEPDPKILEGFQQTRSGVQIAALHFDLGSFVSKIVAEEADEDRDLEELQRVFGLLGLEDFGSGVYSFDIAGRNLREVVRMEVEGAGGGLWKMFGKLPTERSAALEALALPAPRVMEVEGRFDLAHLKTWLPGVLDEIAPDDEDVSFANLEESLQAAVGLGWAELMDTFEGSYAFGLASPPLGMSIPRLAFSVSIANPERFYELLEKAKAIEGLIFENAEYKDVTYTTIKVPNSPVPLIPTFAFVDGQLVITESPNTFKAIVKERSAGPSDDARLQVPADQSAGATVRVSYDVGEAYRLFYDRYFPLVRLGMGQMVDMDSTALVDIDLLPGSDVIAPFLGRGWSVSRVGDGAMTTISESSLGGPQTAIMGSIYGVFGSWIAGMGLEESRSSKERKICRHQLTTIHGALEAYRASFGGGENLPDSLGQLVERGLVEDLDLFLVPSDEEPGDIEYENFDGEIETLESSFKYLPKSKLEVDQDRLYDFEGAGLFDNALGNIPFELSAETEGEKPPQPKKRIILYESNRNRHGGRFILCADGSIYHLAEDDFSELVSVR